MTRFTHLTKFCLTASLLPVLLCLSGCISVKTHSTIEPIYLTLDVNLKVELQKELENAFADLDAASDAVVEE
jgi:hypothetical protein